ncbi:MAG: energy-coupling factor transporter ATP-binding protein [Oscillospiraceae bacterium]|nr:energy-coupling factor transporter ATP-binding protein [Oscillospiraceae bacterium]
MISIKNVTFVYEGKERDGVENLSLDIARGEFVLLCGRSGCGKTTVTRMINGLVPHFYEGDFSGRITVDGMDISQTPMYQIAEKVGSVFQNPRSQFFNVDTDSEIVFGIENLAYPPPVLQKCLDKTVSDLDIEQLTGRSIFELSGGEKQKIAFASVYAMSPEVYVFDEPSSNLDTDAIEKLRKNLLMLKRMGKTILIAEHRLYYLKDLVDLIVYMEQGQIKQVYSQKQFLSMSDVQRADMGLRTMDLSDISVPLNSKKGADCKLKIKDLSLCYKKHIIMRNINLGASCGEVIGIIGHNGAGKSTFLKSLCGLHKQYGGSFRWKEKELKAKDRLKISYMVMQEVGYQLFAESVEQECYFGIKNPDRQAGKQIMRQLGLYGYKDFHPNTLSGGQKQRTAVAVSMVCGREVLVFDEPTSGLDFDSMKLVANLISELSEQQKVIFVVTHDYELLCSVCSRVIHFDDGMVQDDFLVTQQNIEKLHRFFIV